MKKIGLSCLTIILVLLCACNATNKITFLQSSVRLHLPGDDGEVSLDIPYYGETENVKLLSIKDYSSNVKVDPSYVIDYTYPMAYKDYQFLTTHIPMFEDMKVEFSTITYQLDDKEKEADIGIYEIEKSGLNINETAINYSDVDVKNEFWIDIKTDGLGELKEVKATNPDIQVETRIQKIVNKEMGTDTRVYVSYSKPEDYDLVITNFSYTFEHNGKDEVRYGKGVVLFPKDGIVEASGNFESMTFG